MSAPGRSEALIPEPARTQGGPGRVRLWAPHAWIDGAWHAQVQLDAGADGHWSAVTPGVEFPGADTTVLAGPVLPGLVDGHSHAFQRAFAGLAEHREASHDDFWSWRERMYAVALRITPAQMRAVAAHLYVELLRGGYTQVCEFHYLHTREDGSAYDDPMTMPMTLADAAADAGIGMTLVPVVYERAGFGSDTLRDEQRRFRAGPAQVHEMQRAIAGAGRPLLHAGIGVHSLRAALPASIRDLAERVAADDLPFHIHAAEQVREVDDCLAATGRRPIEWLAHEGLLDARWQLVHATHTTPAEIEAVAARGAGVVLCPSTEANLGDGYADLPGWLAGGVPVSLGTDSHVTRSWREELRLLEYGQRLQQRRRNVASAPEQGQPSSAARLFERALGGGARAAGFQRWGLQAGARADLLVVDVRDHALLGIPAPRMLDALVFSSPGRPWRDVMVAGRWVVQDHRRPGAADVAERFEATMQQLWTLGA
jgi:formimidoylglutamate deiminase